jgi:hypothetical protein
MLNTPERQKKILLHFKPIEQPFVEHRNRIEIFFAQKP